MFSEQNIFYFRLCDLFQKQLFRSIKNSHLYITIYREIFIKVFNTSKNTVILPNFLVWKFCGKGQFLHSFGRFAQNYAKTVSFHKMSTPGNYGILRTASCYLFSIIFRRCASDHCN